MLEGFAQVVEDCLWWEMGDVADVNNHRKWWQQLVSNLSLADLEAWHLDWLTRVMVNFQKKLSRGFDMHFTDVVGIFVT